MQEEKLLRKAIFGSIVLLCLCILFSQYARKTMAADAILLWEPAAFAIAEEFQEDTAGPAPADAAVPVATPTFSPALPEGPTPAPAPLLKAWEKVAGAKDSLVVRELQDKSVIVLEKKAGYENAAVSLEELPAARQLRVIISGISGEALGDEQVKRISKDTFYCGTPPTPTATEAPTPTPEKAAGQTPAAAGTPTPTPTLSPSDPYYVWRNDVVKAIETTSGQAADASLTQSLLLTLDKTYVYRLYEDDWNYYIALLRPKDVYEKIIVIDAGHGGLDAGTVSEGNVYLEKTMNLDIVLRLKELLDAQEGIKVYYTRTTDWKPSLRQRVDLANDVEADFFLSVHCNANLVRSLHGTEVLYAAKQDDWEGMNSRRFAQICLEEMDEHLGLLNRGLVARDETLTIIKYAQVPVALVEVAFMSNASDLEMLAKEETRQRAAEGLYDAIMRGYEEMEEGS